MKLKQNFKIHNVCYKRKEMDKFTVRWTDRYDPPPKMLKYV